MKAKKKKKNSSEETQRLAKLEGILREQMVFLSPNEWLYGRSQKHEGIFSIRAVSTERGTLEKELKH